MNRGELAGRLGAVAAGALLVGLGTARCDKLPADEPSASPAPRRLTLPEPAAAPPAKPRPGAATAAAPAATPAAPPTHAQRAQAAREVLGAALRESRRRRDLLASASDAALALPSPPEAAQVLPLAPPVATTPLAQALAASGTARLDPLFPPAPANDAAGADPEAAAPLADNPPPPEDLHEAFTDLALVATSQPAAAPPAPTVQPPAPPPVQAAVALAPAADPVAALAGAGRAEPAAAPVVAPAAELAPAPAPAADPAPAPALAPAPVATPVAAAAPVATLASRAIAPPVAATASRAAPAPRVGSSLPGPATDEAALAPGGPRSALGAAAEAPVLDYQDELILDLRIAGVATSDTVIAYGTRSGTYLPLGTLARILDLAIVVSDDGRYASGWFLDESRTIAIDLNTGTYRAGGVEQPLPADLATAFDGELYLRADAIAMFLPLDLAVDLRGQAVLLTTREPFPFEQRLTREADRRRLEARGNGTQERRWPRADTPWRALDVPLVDAELRAMGDSARGERIEGDLRVAGDIAFLTAEAFLSADSRHGLVSSLIELGRTDPDATLLGPLRATGFSIGDVATQAMPLGLRGVSGRGFTIGNSPLEAASVFERIDLRGVLPDGYEVELYRNDILIGSTAQAINGQYEFLEVPVDFGLNVLRLVFYGPQGQRREEVRRISVGDGRLSPGQLVYRLGAAQNEINLLGVRDPYYIAPATAGDWRLNGELAYGLNSGLTVVASGAWYEALGQQNWLATLGLRGGVGPLAARIDVARGNGGASAASLGIAAQLGGTSFALSHAEYGGGFIDEIRNLGREPLRRASEFNLNTALGLGPVSLPLTLRARHAEELDGSTRSNASLRGSARFGALLASNTLEYARNSTPGLGAFAQLVGNFDLATLARAGLRGRATLGYQLLPGARLTNLGVEADYRLDPRTTIGAQANYALQGDALQVGLSAAREFERFTLALDGNYALDSGSYAVALRLAASFGRNPLHRRGFMARPGIAAQGAAAVRVFHDRDGDRRFSDADLPLGEVDLMAFNQTVRTGADGTALLAGLGNGQRVAVQLMPASLPDITLAPAQEGVEIIARAGRIHQADFAVVSLSEVEGTVLLRQASGSRGVSGVRLLLAGEDGEAAAFSRTESNGYYFFEQVRPGRYRMLLDPEQAARLQLCLDDAVMVEVGHESDIITRDLAIHTCPAP